MSNEKVLVSVEPVLNQENYKISKSLYFFDWHEEREFEVYKLVRSGDSDILGLISFQRIPDEWRIHIRLLSVSKENKGSDKKFDGIAGCLLASVAKLAIEDFAELACISLKPKTVLMPHYIEKYGFTKAGSLICMIIPELFKLILRYEND